MEGVLEVPLPGCRIIEFARRCDVPVIAFDSQPPRGERSGLDARERRAAARIAAWRRRHPRDLLMAVFGELHVTEGRVPRLVREALGRRDGGRRSASPSAPTG